MSAFSPHLLLSLASYLEAGMTASESLGLLAESRNGVVSGKAQAARMAIEKGSSLSDALLSEGVELISKTEHRILQASEECGQVDLALKRISETRAQRQTVRTDWLGRITYPVLLFHVGALAFGVVAMAGGGSLIFTILGWLVPFWGILGLIYFLWQRSLVDPRIAEFFLRVPFVGTYLRRAGWLSFLQTLDTAYRSGMAILPASSLAVDSVDLSLLREKLHAVLAPVRKGEPLSPCLLGLQDLPPTLVHNLENGESTGSLSESLERVNKVLSETQDIHRQRIVKWAGSVVYGVVAFLIVWHIIGFYASYFASAGLI